MSPFRLFQSSNPSIHSEGVPLLGCLGTSRTNIPLLDIFIKNSTAKFFLKQVHVEHVTWEMNASTVVKGNDCLFPKLHFDMTLRTMIPLREEWVYNSGFRHSCVMTCHQSGCSNHQILDTFGRSGTPSIFGTNLPLNT